MHVDSKAFNELPSESSVNPPFGFRVLRDYLFSEFPEASKLRNS